MNCRRNHPKLRARHGGIIFSVLTVLFIFSYLFRLSNGVLGPMFMKDLSLSAQQLGLLVGAFFYAFGTAQIPVGMALDSFGPKRTIMATSLVAVIGSVLTGLASGPPSAHWPHPARPRHVLCTHGQSEGLGQLVRGRPKRVTS